MDMYVRKRYEILNPDRVIRPHICLHYIMMLVYVIVWPPFLTGFPRAVSAMGERFRGVSLSVAANGRVSFLRKTYTQSVI